MRLIVCALLGLSLWGCSAQTDRHAGNTASGLTGPLRDVSPEVFAAIDRDCLQYPVSRDDDGTDIWYADYVYFYLVNTKDGDIHKGDDGEPVASGLLHSEVVAFMERQPPIPETGWRWRVKRIIRHMRDGAVVRDEEATTVDDVDLDELLRLDRAARSG